MPDAIATGIDHLNAGVRDVRAVAGVLTDDLGLGIAFPYSEYPDWVTAGVSVGDATLAIDTAPLEGLDLRLIAPPPSPAAS